MKALRNHKISHPGVMPNIATVVCSVIHDVHPIRAVMMLNHQARQELSEWCAVCITKHLRFIMAVCPGAVPPPRIRSITIGLLYLMRTGVQFHGIVVLPRCPVLQYVLPMESYLYKNYGIRSKIITETENLIKSIIRSCSMDTLSKCGIECVERLINT